MMRVHAVGLLACAGCWTGGSAPAAARPEPAAPAGAVSMSEAACGPIDARTPATLGALRRAFAGFEVRPSNDDSGLEYDVYQNGELLLYVVPDDDGTIFNAHATSPKVAVAGRDWRVGAPFQGAAQLTTCQCWGENPTCWHDGDHLAVNFARECGDLETSDRRVLRVLDGVAVQRIIWSPKPFGANDAGDRDGD